MMSFWRTKNQLLIWFMIFLIRADDFTIFKAQMEAIVLQMANELSSSFETGKDEQCQELKIKEIQDQCSSIKTYAEYTNLPQHLQCERKKLILSMNPVYQFMEPAKRSRLTCSEAQFIYYSKRIFPKFQSINKHRMRRFSRAYFASPDGILLSHPGMPSYCSAIFDPRHQPWYVNSVTGQKNIIVFVNTRSQQKRIKEIGEYLIKTGNTQDWISFVDLNRYENDENICFMKMKNTNKEQFLQAININCSEQQWTEQQYRVLGEAANHFFNELPHSMRQTIVIITDKQIQSNFLADSLKKIQQTEIRLIPIVVNQRDTEDLDNLACSLKGFLIKDDKNEKIHKLMKKYAQYFNEGIDQKRPIWSTVYNDQSGFGNVITMSKPVYFQQKLIAVAGLDISFSYLVNHYQLSMNQIYEQFVTFRRYNYEVKSLHSYCHVSQISEEYYENQIEWTEGYVESNNCPELRRNNMGSGIQVTMLSIILLFVFCVILSLKEQQEMKEASIEAENIESYAENRTNEDLHKYLFD